MLTRHHVDGISKMPVVVIEVFLEVSTDADAGLKRPFVPMDCPLVVSQEISNGKHHQ